MKLLSFSSVVQSAAARAQASASVTLDFTVGSVLRAIVEAVAGVVMWLQYLVLQVLAMTRAATSTGADLDSWYADFGFTRLPAVAAHGNVTFTRFATGGIGLVNAGVQVLTADGTQTFTVVADTTNPAWSPALNGYYMAAGTGSVTVAVQAVTPGAAGNALANTVTLIGSGGATADQVTNASAFAGGIDAETDAAFRARFALYIAGLRMGTLAAIKAAVAGVQQGLTVNIVENYDGSNVWTPGLLTITVDDGSGSPSVALLAKVSAAIDAVRAASVRFTVSGPSVVTANVAMTLTTAAGYVHATVAAQVQAAVTAAINALPVGQSLPYTQLAALAYVPGVSNVTGLTLNSGTSDLAATASQVIRAGTVTVA